MTDKPLSMLKGVRILSFTQFLFGPAGVQYLGDMGADIIKIEPPGGRVWERNWSGGETFVNGVSAFYMLSHRNARSLTLNLKDPRGQEVARRLIGEADVLVENFRPGVMERFGLSYEAVREINPSIIYASASGYGSNSPYRDLPGQDLLVQAMAGLVAATGYGDRTPISAGAAIVDQHGAALLAMGILGALFHRQRTGEGQKVEVSLLQSALDLQTEPVVYYLNGGKVRRPAEPLGSSFHAAPYGIYDTQDGHIALSLTPIKVIRRALGNPSELEPYEDPKLAMDKKDEIHRALAPFLRSRTTAEWVELLRSHDVWCAPVNGYPEVFEDPAVEYMDPVLKIEHPRAGEIRVLKHPVWYSSGSFEMRRIPPESGEHTEEILRGLDYSAEEIEGLRSGGVI